MAPVSFLTFSSFNSAPALCRGSFSEVSLARPHLRRGLAAFAPLDLQIHDLLALLETLRGVTQEGDDAFNRLFHAVEFRERWMDPHRAVHEDASESRIRRGVLELSDHLPDRWRDLTSPVQLLLSARNSRRSELR
jgi:hypothetical protein